MLNEGRINLQIVAALTRLGSKTSTRSLQRFLKSWDLRRPSGTTGVRIGGVSDELAEAVHCLFHHTTLNDTQLAARYLTDYQLHTTTFGGEYLTTYLRVHYGYKARRLDVSIAQRVLDGHDKLA